MLNSAMAQLFDSCWGVGACFGREHESRLGRDSFSGFRIPEGKDTCTVSRESSDRKAKPRPISLVPKDFCILVPRDCAFLALSDL